MNDKRLDPGWVAPRLHGQETPARSFILDKISFAASPLYMSVTSHRHTRPHMLTPHIYAVLSYLRTVPCDMSLLTATSPLVDDVPARQ